MEDIQEIREYVRKQDILLADPRSGSVPKLSDIIDEKQYSELVDDVLPAYVRQDKKTMEYLSKLAKCNTCSMVPTEKYVTNKTPIAHQCCICGYETRKTPSSILAVADTRRGCPNCNHKNGTSLEDAVLLFEVKGTNITPLSGFAKRQDKIPMRCNTCHYTWETRPLYVIRGDSGCPKCSKTKAAEQHSKTHGQFVSELTIANENIRPLEQYERANKKIRVEHTICGHIWEAYPKSLLLGTGCPLCTKNTKKRTTGKRKTHAQFQNEMQELHPDIEVLGQYVNNKTKILVRHSCGREFEITPGSLLAGRGCDTCNRRRHYANMTKTHEQFVNELNKIHDDIIVLSKYANTHTKITVQHVPCGNIWEITPRKLLNGQGCPKCNKRPKLDDAEYDKRLREANIPYRPLSPIKNIDAKIEHLCPKCNRTWETTPYNVLLGYGCPRCKGHRQSKEEVLEEISELSSGTITMTGAYEGKTRNVSFECAKCGTTWITQPYNVLHGSGCPKCSSKASFPEKSIYYYLYRDCDEEVLSNPRIEIPHLDMRFEADIFVPSRKLFVEYDGYYWHNNAEAYRRYEQREKAIQDIGYRCLHVVETRGSDISIPIWIMEPPLIIESKNHKRDSSQLDSVIASLEERIGIKTTDEINCINDMRKIEEEHQKSKILRMAILPNGTIDKSE